ncbi:hypothetical protein JTB14_030447 [Gonioctena quinquepunctata]|nr:hypothetical protein JTB14_030447 [Gonioctena quinquepunctata]
MATSQQTSTEAPCKRCGNVAESELKSANCVVLSHAGCLKHMKNIIYLYDCTIECCSTKEDVDFDSTFESAKDQPPVESYITEIKYMK